MKVGSSLVVGVVALLSGAGAAHAATPATGGPPGQVALPLHWIKIHGWLMWISMGFLMPLAIILIRFSKKARMNGDAKTLKMLFNLHFAIQILAVCGTIAGALVGMFKFGNTFPYTHERLGLALIIVVWLAPIVGLIRPTHGVSLRPLWYAAHWLLGTGGVILGFINIYIGMHIYETITQKSLRTLNILFSIQLSIMGFVYLKQDRWDYLLEQGHISKPVGSIPGTAPARKAGVYAPRDSDGPNSQHTVQVVPNN